MDCHYFLKEHHSKQGWKLQMGYLEANWLAFVRSGVAPRTTQSNHCKSFRTRPGDWWLGVVGSPPPPPCWGSVAGSLWGSSLPIIPSSQYTAQSRAEHHSTFTRRYAHRQNTTQDNGWNSVINSPVKVRGLETASVTEVSICTTDCQQSCVILHALRYSKED